ncbi:MAG: threonine synthase, partial [Pseudomonadota bacterium]
MRYVSTRGRAPALGFQDAMLSGLARDGGLYVPESWPTLDPETIRRFAGQSYEDVAYTVMRPFVGDAFDGATFRNLIERAYA